MNRTNSFIIQDIVILAVESSCDDTSVAILHNGKMLANITAGQEVHRSFGGVVPELASRAHQSNIIPVADAALKKAKVQKKDLSAIAFTRGPGLPGSLMVGTSFAKALALGLEIPLIEVHHMQAHVLAHFIEKLDETKEKPNFPFLCLTVSGGHTQLVLVHDYFQQEIIGETLDDAAGEAFDKIAKITGLPYPGGPLIDKNAAFGNPLAFSFPHPKIKDFDFSFSGLKTSVLYFLQKKMKENPNFIQDNMNDLCASVQKTIVDILMHKTDLAVKKYQIKDIALAGGVSANSELRKRFSEYADKNGLRSFIPEFQFCTDNAAMIGICGYYKFKMGLMSDQSVTSSARLKM